MLSLQYQYVIHVEYCIYQSSPLLPLVPALCRLGLLPLLPPLSLRAPPLPSLLTLLQCWQIPISVLQPGAQSVVPVQSHSSSAMSVLLCSVPQIGVGMEHAGIEQG